MNRWVSVRRRNGDKHYDLAVTSVVSVYVSRTAQIKYLCNAIGCAVGHSNFLFTMMRRSIVEISIKFGYVILVSGLTTL